MLKVKTYFQNSFSGPSAWYGLLYDERHWRARYNCGWLRVMADWREDRMCTYSETEADFYYEAKVGDDLDGIMTFEQLQEHTRDVLDFSEATNLSKKGRRLRK